MNAFPSYACAREIMHYCYTPQYLALYGKTESADRFGVISFKTDGTLTGPSWIRLQALDLQGMRCLPGEVELYGSANREVIDVSNSAACRLVKRETFDGSIPAEGYMEAEVGGESISLPLQTVDRSHQYWLRELGQEPADCGGRTVSYTVEGALEQRAPVSQKVTKKIRLFEEREETDCEVD